MIKCPVCTKNMIFTAVRCAPCDIDVQGEFKLPRLMRLSPESQKLAEAFLLNGGNLKAMTSQLDISYPTLRKAVDGLIKEMEALKAIDEKEIGSILDAIEKGEMSSEKGLRLIKEIGGEL